MKKINIKGPIVSNDTAWIYNYFGWDAACPKTINQGLIDAAGEDVVIEINSQGGICVYAYEMYTAIMGYSGRVTVHVISACSAATLLVCAANEALISDTGLFMIHNTQSRAVGDYRDMQQEADALKEINAGIINAYVRKTGKSREEIQNLMDDNTYMSPQTAIEHGFVDGYMFGDPNKKETDPEEVVTNIVAADIPIIPEDKAKYLMQLMKREEVVPVQQQNDGENGAVADPDIENRKGESKMKLEEYLAENPEERVVIDKMIADAKTEGITTERNRIQSLDAIAATVTPEALDNAKYGEKPIDGPALAYQEMVNGKKLASAYMADAIQDYNDSGVGNVGTGVEEPSAPVDQSDEMAAAVNQMKGGR